MEVKNSPPPLKTSLYKGVFVKLVEVEVKSEKKMKEYLEITKKFSIFAI